MPHDTKERRATMVVIAPPNKHLQCAVPHKVLGRGRPSVSPWSAPSARVLTGQRAGADVGR